MTDDEIDVARGSAQQSDATIDTDPDTLAAVLWGGRSHGGPRQTGSQPSSAQEKATVLQSPVRTPILA